MDIETNIRRLIDSKREDDYWDFKEEPHDNNAELLHDILCLANSLHKGDRFLIFGVTDPKEGTKIKGLTPNQKNRKTQVQYIDFLRSKPFAGDCRPEIELQTLMIDNLEIDVLIIFDNPLKPYYLTEYYKFKPQNNKETVVRANYIYSRTNDTNTPIDKSADIGKIEKMWKQRFGLDLSPIERMKLLLLKPNDWFKDIGNKPCSYHLEFPEFRIEFSEVIEFWEVFSFFFTNEKSFLGNATFKYHSTTLFELEYMYCDEMRISLSLPNTEYLRLNDSENWYYYFDLNELNGKFLYFMTNGFSYLKSRSSGFPFIIFENKQQRKLFNNYVVENQKLLEDIKPGFHGEHAKKRMKQQDKDSVIDPVFIDKLLQLYEKWALHNIVY
jgi:hypothetical protein